MKDDRSRNGRKRRLVELRRKGKKKRTASTIRFTHCLLHSLLLRDAARGKVRSVCGSAGRKEGGRRIKVGW